MTLTTRLTLRAECSVGAPRPLPGELLAGFIATVVRRRRQLAGATCISIDEVPKHFFGRLCREFVFETQERLAYDE
jgi:hypothetical protein